MTFQRAFATLTWLNTSPGRDRPEARRAFRVSALARLPTAVTVAAGGFAAAPAHVES